eukprot:CAMPEP_0115846784 /NCGR_PEP_ID=MMETSP0287-20121206/10039_1 /TAXON_ID=412157 /ORGANISM="Chrysochromulina rotalis, Strain UIO044" /LENGTH=378 /DNA_ID=CAMNT_0003300585 /DNA_START=193 /DNA_END=1330 /DNA_ORIENTATION=-
MQAAEQQSSSKLTCNSSTRVVVSIAVGDETPACSWVDSLVINALAFTLPSTAIMIHISSRLKCNADEIASWSTVAASQNRLLAVNQKRLASRGAHGSVLYAHLLNVRAAAARWRAYCYVVLQASNMLWVRQGMEARVEKLRCSVGREGWRKPNIEMPLLVAGYHPGSAGDVITARYYHNVTGSRYPMSAREIFAVRQRQPEKLPGRKNVTRFGWSYHEGAFYPFQTVMRFLAHLESSLTARQILEASNSPEEWWLQAWALNREPISLPIQRVAQQLCMRLNVSQGASHVPAKYVVKMRDDLLCPGPPGSYRYYALKRFARNATDEVTAQALLISSELYTRGVAQGNNTSNECKRAVAGGADCHEKRLRLMQPVTPPPS